MRSKYIGISVLIFFFIISSAQAQVSFHTGFHLEWWTNDTGDYGRQSHIPLVLEGEFDAFSFSLTTAEVYNRFEPEDGDISNINGQTDTLVNLGYEIMDRWPVDLLVALDVNLPSGKTGLDDEDVINISRPDLFTITRMGQGLNINPSVTLLKQWERLLASIGIGYIWRGSYDASDALSEYDPGSALSLTAETAYYFTPRWTARLFGGWTGYTTDQCETLDGKTHDYYKPGDVWSFGAEIGYTRAQWHINGILTRVIRGKESHWEYPDDLVTEDRNSYGNEWTAKISGGYSLTDRTDIKADITYIAVDANDYKPSDVSYESKRTRTTIGCEVTHRWSAVFESGLRLSTFTLAVDDNPDDWDEEDDFNGGSATLWGTILF
jgi:hypothetical protein